jgi:hypothetical protein
MPAKKSKPTPVARKTVVQPPVEPRSGRPASVALTAASASTRLLREAAWSRMFGRVESKNPFTR